MLLRGVENPARTRAVAAARILDSRKALSGPYKDQLTLDAVLMIVRDEDGGILQQVNLPRAGEDQSTVWRAAIKSGEPASRTVTFSGDDPYYLYAVPVDPGARAPPYPGPDRAGHTPVVKATREPYPCLVVVSTIHKLRGGG